MAAPVAALSVAEARSASALRVLHRRPLEESRWADIEASDDDEEEDRVSFLDDISNEVMNTTAERESESFNADGPCAKLLGPRSHCVFDLGTPRGAPEEFNIGTPRDVSEALRPPKACAMRVMADSSEAAVVRSQTVFNVSAPEFIPTQSMHCPLVGTVFGIEEESLGEGLVEPAGLPASASDAKGTESAQADLLPDAAHESSLAHDCLDHPQKARRAKCRPPSVRTKAKAAKAEAAPNAVTEQPQNAADEMPEATEEEWQHRIQMRIKALLVGKATCEYVRYLEEVPREEREADEPQTPDPTDRSMSKRRWKYVVHQWHMQLRQRCGNDDRHGASTTCSGSVLSTEEWQSIITDTTQSDD
eukprot:gnl/TRDRNA2_/TRDRNA2_81262_c0_seq2.p1 gnl/TRDRNA2_/TRDRNA2_81262_c0~~gnl/TRDRNA2_/TRDRNA2_81262_c0_seq2.p1  ORF type:complete len:361 (+),score=57.54 gnl/TRDRNA2_/TRDRNA2_81262_c0_seq2:41-1123(+)